jgi:TolB-like protein
MNMRKFLYLLIVTFFISGCEVKMAPSHFWTKLFRTQTDSNYYKEKSEDLVQSLTNNIAEYEINKVTVMDLVDEENLTPILGEYFASRVVEAITKKYFFKDKIFRVAQKGEVNAIMAQLNLKPSYLYNKEEIRQMGKALNSQAIITGRITDLGTNIDVHLTLTDVMSGEVIASATEHLTRTKFAVEMLRQH